MRRNLKYISFLIIAILLLSGCGVRYFKNNSEDVVKVGCRNFTEQYILGEIIAQVFESEGVEVERVFGMGGVKLAHDTLVRNKIDIYPEYTGAIYQYILKKDFEKGNDDIYMEIVREYKNEYDLEILEKGIFNNSSVLLASDDVIEKYTLKNYSDIGKNANDLIFCAPAEFWERKDGMNLLQDNYKGFDSFKEQVKMDMGMQYKALKNDDIHIALGNSTDSQLNSDKLKVIEDDKNIWPPYNPVPISQKRIVDEYPEAIEKLNKVFSNITDERIKKLNYELDNDESMELDEIVRKFLDEEVAI